MYKPFTKATFLLLFSAASLTACKKDNDKEKSRKDLLTEKEWKYVEYGRDTDNDGILDKEEVKIEACEVDDTFKFNTDGTLVSHDNTARCTSGDEAETYNWAFQKNETEIVLSSGRLIKIKTLTESTFECTSEMLDGSSTTKIITIFKH
ncbi:hypothetical protein FAM09_20285 [Niastella caeni]|uniref:Lipocalin-like domain-containing protein n=1 Tax=Niastella caeni TaxID=2569763 RepID=A0A4V4H0P1_9BACT|nr:lipocalin family protein [Niastella caeni]THU37286.1 hypothetical protein FAM09_20285 [Niastella caeni]